MPRNEKSFRSSEPPYHHHATTQLSGKTFPPLACWEVQHLPGFDSDLIGRRDSGKQWESLFQDLLGQREVDLRETRSTKLQNGCFLVTGRLSNDQS